MSADEIQKALLEGRWEDQLQNIPPSPARDAAKIVVDGALREVLTSPTARQLFTIAVSDPTEEILNRPLDELFSFVTNPTDVSEDEELMRLVVAVACLQAFIQANWTGPDLDVKPLDVIFVPSSISQTITEESLCQRSIVELAYGGEPAYHLAEVPVFLRLAKILLNIPYKYCRSVPWWRLRAWLVHQQLLDESAAMPTDVLTSVEPLLHDFATDPDLAGRLILEQGLLQHHLGHDKAAAEYFIRAARVTRLEFELTGALGRRTKFQQNDITQLVLLAESRNRDARAPVDDGDAGEASSVTGVSDPINNNTDVVIPETLALNDDTLLEQTQFTSSSAGAPDSRLAHLDPSSQPPLHPLDQCILLALCLNVKNTSPSHGLTAEQMSPYVARVISHPANWSVHTMSLLLRSRLESTRTRTVERSTLQLQALVDQMPSADASIPERLRFFYSIPLPSKWELEKELALRFLSLGVVKSALAIFERREMWEEVVRCWHSLERPDKGIAIVRDLLEGRKSEADAVLAREKASTADRRQTLDALREAKFWCLLGDFEPEHAQEHYTRAWDISGESSGRAMRSLGGFYFARSEYTDAIQCLRRAVSINPLLTRTWFVLGCSCIRVEDWEGARDAFVRCVSIEDEDAESWSNLASVYLRMGEVGKVEADPGVPETMEGEAVEERAGQMEQSDDARESIPFANKMLAFRALKQGLKFSYDNWRLWSNYMVVAVDVGELSEACRALARIVEERSDKDGIKCLDEDVLERLVGAVTRAPSNPDDAVEGGGTDVQAVRNPNEGHGLLRRVTDLFERTILPRVSSPRIFRAWARLLTWQSRWEDAVRAYLDGYRCGTAGTMEKGEADVNKWREGVAEVEDIVDVLRNFGSRVDGFNWKLQARSIVRTFIGKMRDFEDEPEWSRLMSLQEELRKEG